MNLQEFQKRVDKAETGLIACCSMTGSLYYQGVCTVIFLLEESIWRYGSLLDSPVVEEFTQIFRPKNSRAYWLGDLTEENLPLRKEKLREFEAHCIEHKLYEGWE